MGNLLNAIPFTEIYERLLTMARIDTVNNTDYAKGIVNDVYKRVLPRIADWEPLVKESFVACSPYYATGTVAVTVATTSVVGAGTTWTAGMLATDGWKIKFNSNDNVYDFTYTSASTGTISPALSGTDSLAGASYQLFRDEYQLASDFDRFLKEGSLYVMSGGRVQNTIAEADRSVFRNDFVVEAQDPIRMCLLTQTHSTSGSRLVRINPPPRTAKVYPYDYIRQLSPMTDYTVGTATVTASSTGVMGVGTLWAGNVAVGDYFRIDATGRGDSSKWYKIVTVTDNTHIVLDSAYAESTESGAIYTISKAPVALPEPFHEFILYEGAFIVMSEQSDTVSQLVMARRTEILADLKKNYKSRRSNVQFGVEDDGYR